MNENQLRFQRNVFESAFRNNDEEELWRQQINNNCEFWIFKEVNDGFKTINVK